jgi:hypothetical protein
MPNYRFGTSAEPDFGPLVKPYFDEDEDIYDEDDEDFGEEEFDPNFDPNEYLKDFQPEKKQETGEKPLIYDSLAEDSLYDTSEKRDIPFVDHGTIETRKDDDDEPVFFEEPV